MSDFRLFCVGCFVLLYYDTLLAALAHGFVSVIVSLVCYTVFKHCQNHESISMQSGSAIKIKDN
jgi:hypothetical protein